MTYLDKKLSECKAHHDEIFSNTSEADDEEIDLFDYPPYQNIDFESQNCWGLPNWREPNSYSFSKTMTHEKWRWEFIRRSRDYRTAWLKLQNERTQGDAVQRHCPLSNGHGGVASKFHIDILVSPSFDSTYLWTPFTRPGEHTVHNFLESWDFFSSDFLEVAGSSGVVVAMISPAEPLKPQFERIANIIDSYPPSILKRFRMERGRDIVEGKVRADKYPLYLRLLDARDKFNGCQASWTEIERTLRKEHLPIAVNRDSIRRAYKQAVSAQQQLLNNPPYK